MLQLGSRSTRTFWWLRRVLVGKGDLKFEEAAFPDSLLLAWHTTIPLLELHHAVRAAHRFREEAKRVVASPLLPEYTVSACAELFTAASLPLLGETVHTQ
jgi:hypothetical protein